MEFVICPCNILGAGDPAVNQIDMFSGSSKQASSIHIFSMGLAVMALLIYVNGKINKDAKEMIRIIHYWKNKRKTKQRIIT